MMGHGRGARREDRHVGAALADQAELVLLQRLADLVVGDGGVRGRRVARLERGLLRVAPVIMGGRRGRIMAVAIDDHAASAAAGAAAPRRRCTAAVARAISLPEPRPSRRRGDLLHLGRAPEAVGAHPAEIVIGARRPVRPRPARVERGRDLVGDAGLARGEEAFGGQRLDPLHHHRAQHLDRRGAADRPVDPARAEAQRGKRGAGVGPADQQRHREPRGMDRRHHRDVGIGGARRLDQPRRFLLGLRRDAVEIAIKRARRDRPGRRLGRGQRLVGRDQREDEPGPGKRLAQACRAGHAAARIIGALGGGERGILGLDVIGDGVGAPGGGEGHARLAEADQSDCARLRHRRPASCGLSGAANPNGHGPIRFPEVCPPRSGRGAGRERRAARAPAANRRAS